MAGLRVVPPTDPQASGEPVPMSDALAALTAQIAAEQPRLILIVYETAAGEIRMRSLPASGYVSKILAAEAYALLYPNSDMAE